MYTYGLYYFMARATERLYGLRQYFLLLVHEYNLSPISSQTWSHHYCPPLTVLFTSSLDTTQPIPFRFLRSLDYDYARASGPVVGEVHNPHALPMYQKESKKRQQEVARKDPKRTKIPEPPRPSLDQVGRGTSAANYTQV